MTENNLFIEIYDDNLVSKCSINFKEFQISIPTLFYIDCYKSIFGKLIIISSNNTEISLCNVYYKKSNISKLINNQGKQQFFFLAINFLLFLF